MFSYAIFPVMSRFHISSKNALRKTLEKSAKYLFIIGLPLGVGATILADQIILLIYGQAFAPSIAAMQVLALYLPLRFVNNATGYTLSAINKEHLRALSATIAAAGNIALNLFLIPKYSLVGASIATAITELVLFACYYYFVAKYFYRLRLSPIFTRPMLACVAMAIFAFYLRGLNLVLLIASAIIIYTATLYLIKGFDSMDKMIIRTLTEGIRTRIFFR
jgi:O-antigen/teichoic acid export membrane protein